MDDAQIEENLKKAQSIDLTWAKKLKAGAPVYYTNGEDIHQFNFVGHIPSLLTMEKQVLAYCPKEREIVRFNFGDLFGNRETLQLYTSERFR